MNILSLIKQAAEKKQRLQDAQMLMAKAYRGVPYVDAQHDDPVHAACCCKGAEYTS